MRGFLHLVLALAIGAFAGWISARSMIENLPLKAVAGIDSWREYNGADELLLPYAVGHFSSRGELPPPNVARYFHRTVDDDGNSLRGECIYEVKGRLLPARWWSMAIANPRGERSVIAAGDVMRESDGSLILSLAPFPVPGNRLTSPPGSQLTFSYVIQPDTPDAPVASLPALRKVRC